MGEAGIVLVYNPETDAKLCGWRQDLNLHARTADADAMRRFDALANNTENYSVRTARPDRRTNPSGEKLDPLGDIELILDDGRSFWFERNQRPEAARVLSVCGLAQAKAALAAEDAEQRAARLATAKETLEAARGLLEPFYSGAPGYRLSEQLCQEVNVSGGALTGRMTIGRRQRHELVRAPFAQVLSSIGRVALAEGDAASAGCLGLAHDAFRTSGDKAGQTRNVLYMLLGERATGRFGQFARNIGRLGRALAAATVTGQLEAWRATGRMVPYLGSQEWAKRALTDWHAV